MTMTRDKIAEIKGIAEDMRRKNYHVYSIYTDELLSLLALAERALEPQGQALEPDWSNSETLCSEFWKNPGLPITERLLIADGAVHFRDKVIANLRRQLSDTASQLALPAGPQEDSVTMTRAELRAYSDQAFALGVEQGKEAVALPAGPVPEGWKLVPIRPTRDMLVAAGFARGDGEEQWSDMLDAAPSPAVAQPVADERKAFEQWCKGEFPGLEVRVQNLLGTYTKTMTEWLYTGWQARAALCQPAEEGDKA